MTSETPDEMDERRARTLYNVLTPSPSNFPWESQSEYVKAPYRDAIRAFCKSDAEQADALADDLENQCNELKAGMDQAEGRVAELEAENAAKDVALREVMQWIDNWDVAFLDDSEWPETNRKVTQALSDSLGGKLLACRDSLDEIINYKGGADNALEDEYVMARALAALDDKGGG